VWSVKCRPPVARRVVPRVGLVLLVLGVAGCPRPTPPPAFSGQNIDSVAGSIVNAYGATLQFDTVAPRADTAIVPISGGGTARLQIAPEVGLAGLRHSDLVTGRITARIYGDAPYDTLGFAQGINYVWTDSTSKGWREIIFRSDNSRFPEAYAAYHQHWLPLNWTPSVEFLRTNNILLGLWQHVIKGCMGGGANQALINNHT
jgi:hypothetical protein